MESIASAGLYFTTHGVNMSFVMPEFSSSRIINHHSHVNNDKGKPYICHEMLIGCALTVQLILLSDFKRQVLQWDGVNILMK